MTLIYDLIKEYPQREGILIIFSIYFQPLFSAYNSSRAYNSSKIRGSRLEKRKKKTQFLFQKK